MNYMKKIFLGLAAALMLTACNENRQPEATASVDSASVVTDLMMSRRSIRAYKDSAISRDTLNEILKCGINAPNGQNLQSYEIRVIDSPALIDSITQAVVKDNPKIAERKGFKNIFVNAHVWFASPMILLMIWRRLIAVCWARTSFLQHGQRASVPAVWAVLPV